MTANNPHNNRMKGSEAELRELYERWFDAEFLRKAGTDKDGNKVHCLWHDHEGIKRKTAGMLEAALKDYAHMLEQRVQQSIEDMTVYWEPSITPGEAIRRCKDQARTAATTVFEGGEGK